MKNLILLSLFLASSSVFSQSIEVEAQVTNVDSSNSTSTFGDLATKVLVKNISSSEIQIKVSREVIEETAGTKNYFCWVACYSSSTDVSPHSKPFSAGQVDATNFAVHFDNLGIVPASAKIRYCAFNADNESDSACTIVNYTVAGTSSIKPQISESFSNFYPNPTASITKLNYALGAAQSAKVVVTDMLGNIIQHKLINGKEGTLVFDVSNTPKGLYFANIYVNNEVSEVKRLIVNR